MIFIKYFVLSALFLLTKMVYPATQEARDLAQVFGVSAELAQDAIDSKGGNIEQAASWILEQEHKGGISLDQKTPQLLLDYVHIGGVDYKKAEYVIRTHFSHIQHQRLEETSYEDQVAISNAFADYVAEQAIKKHPQKTGPEILAMRGLDAPSGIHVAILLTQGCLTHKGLLRAVDKHKAQFNLTKISFINAEEIQNGSLFSYDVFLVPGGDHFSMLEELGPVGQENIRSFVRAGGSYIGTCGGLFLAEWLGLTPTFSIGSDVSSLGLSGNIKAQPEAAALSWGIENVRIDLSVTIPPITTLLPKNLVSEEITSFAALFTCKNDVVDEFIKSRALPQEQTDKYRQITNLMPDSLTAFTSDFSKGKIVCFTSHPESSGDHADILIGLSIHQTCQAQPSLTERISHYELTKDAFIEVPIEYTKHGFHRYINAPKSFFEQTDSNKNFFTPEQARNIVLKIIPKEMSKLSQIDALIASLTHASGKVDLRNVLKKILYQSSFQTKHQIS